MVSVFSLKQCRRFQLVKNHGNFMCISFVGILFGADIKKRKMETKTEKRLAALVIGMVLVICVLIAIMGLRELAYWL